MLRRGSKRYITILLLSLLLGTGCTEGSLFFPDLEEEKEASVSTVPSGSVVGSGDTLPVKLSEEGSGEYTSLEIRILTTDGTSVYTETYDSAILSEPVLPDLDLPPLEEGSYIVELLLFSQQEEVARERSLIFYTDARFTIHGITLYPPTSETDALVIAEANISSSDPTMDPYLRWRFDGSLLTEGSVSEKGTTARIASGGETGVFTLTAELFPWAPPVVPELEPAPPAAHSTDVVVRRQGENSSVGEDVYLSYSFDGHSRAAGAAIRMPGIEPGVFDWEREGEPLLTLSDELFGYRLDSENRFFLERSIMPATADRLYPFEVRLDFAPIAVPSTGTSILGSGDGDREFVLGLSGNGAPWVWLQGGARTAVVEAPSVGLVSGESTSLQIEFTPLGEETRISFYAGGLLLYEENLALDLRAGSDRAGAQTSGKGEESATGDSSGADPAADSSGADGADPAADSSGASGDTVVAQSSGTGTALDSSGLPLPRQFREARVATGSSLVTSPGATVVIEELSVTLAGSAGIAAFASPSDGSPADESSDGENKVAGGSREAGSDAPSSAPTEAGSDAAGDTSTASEGVATAASEPDGSGSPGASDSAVTALPEQQASSGDAAAGSADAVERTADSAGAEDTEASGESGERELAAGEARRVELPEAGGSVTFSLESYGPGAGVFFIEVTGTEKRELAYLPSGATVTVTGAGDGATYAVDGGEDKLIRGDAVIFRNPSSGTRLTLRWRDGEL